MSRECHWHQVQLPHARLHAAASGAARHPAHSAGQPARRRQPSPPRSASSPQAVTRPQGDHGGGCPGHRPAIRRHHRSSAAKQIRRPSSSRHAGITRQGRPAPGRTRPNSDQHRPAGRRATTGDGNQTARRRATAADGNQTTRRRSTTGDSNQTARRRGTTGECNQAARRWADCPARARPGPGSRRLARSVCSGAGGNPGWLEAARAAHVLDDRAGASADQAAWPAPSHGRAAASPPGTRHLACHWRPGDDGPRRPRRPGPGARGPAGTPRPGRITAPPPLRPPPACHPAMAMHGGRGRVIRPERRREPPAGQIG